MIATGSDALAAARKPLTHRGGQLLPGTVLAHYRIMEHVASGGMGGVYRAYEAALNREVAIKVLRPDFALRMEYVEMFEEEARAIAALRHPNIVPIYFIGQDSGVVFFAMAFIRGEDGLKRLRRIGRVDGRALRDVALQAVSALEEAWRHGIIHRDIKPSNLLFEEGTGRIMIADFGLARCVKQVSALAGFTAGWGSPGYVSPEQILDKPCDFRSDIYSLGATLFHMATGTTVFESAQTTDEVQGHLYAEFPADNALRMRVDPGWVSIIEKMMQKEPAERYASYEELRNDIYHAQEVLQFESRSSRPRVSPMPKREGWDENLAFGLLKASPGSLALASTSMRVDIPHDLLARGAASPSLEKSAEIFRDLCLSHDGSQLGDILEMGRLLPELEDLVTHLANHPMFFEYPVQNFEDAVNAVGMTRCAKLGFMLLAVKHSGNPHGLFDWRIAFIHGLATGLLAEECVRSLELSTTDRELECGFMKTLSLVLAADVAPLAVQTALLRSIREMMTIQDALKESLNFTPCDVLFIWMKQQGMDLGVLDVLCRDSMSPRSPKVKLSQAALRVGSFLASSQALGYIGGGILEARCLEENAAFRQLVNAASISDADLPVLVDWLNNCAASLAFLIE